MLVFLKICVWIRLILGLFSGETSPKIPVYTEPTPFWSSIKMKMCAIEEGTQEWNAPNLEFSFSIQKFHDEESPRSRCNTNVGLRREICNKWTIISPQKGTSVSHCLPVTCFRTTPNPSYFALLHYIFTLPTNYHQLLHYPFIFALPMLFLHTHVVFALHMLFLHTHLVFGLPIS